MKVTLAWLREFAPLKGSAEEIADQLADLGLPVEDMFIADQPVDGVVAAKILDVRVHPRADKIRLVDVDAGDGSPLQICCGAANLFVGDIVPLATVGTVMPNGMEIAFREMRGEASNGMLCSARELGLGDEHEGILVLPSGAEIGMPYGVPLGLTPDVVFDLDITPNRPEALSVAGIARDLAARQGVNFAYPSPTSSVVASGDKVDNLVEIAIEDVGLCGRFAARVLRGLEVRESLPWMQRRLINAGMRPINNIVDVSNYVMLEMGQPSHAFDFDKLPDGRLIVRTAGVGEHLVTLDGKDRSLATTDGVICDATGSPIALAGVMGGATTEISESSTNVLVEMAWWDPLRVEATATAHQLHSEASLRFKRGSDPEIYDRAMDRFVELLSETCDVTVHPGTVVVDGNLPKREVISVRAQRVSAILGREVTAAMIGELLEPIGFDIAIHGGADDDPSVGVLPPPFRPDCTLEIDVIEEIARTLSYATIEPVVPRPPQTGRLSVRQRRTRRLREALVAQRIDEAMPLPFLAPGELERCGLDSSGLRLANPLVADESVLRTSLLPGLIRTLAHNASHRMFGVRLYEIGRVFPPGGFVTDSHESVRVGRVLDSEAEMAAACLGGSDASEAVQCALIALDALGFSVDRVAIEQASIAGLHPTRSSELHVDGIVVGAVGEVHPDVLSQSGVLERVGYVELALDKLLAGDERAVQARPVSKFPYSEFDLSFVVSDQTRVSRLVGVVAESNKLIVRAQAVDLYRTDALGDGRQSVTINVRVQSFERTLSESEINSARHAAINAAQSVLDARLRA